MKESDFSWATPKDREKYTVRPYEEVHITELSPGAFSHLFWGENIMVSFLTMKAGSIFPLHSHPEEQIMIVVDGYCDEVIEDKIYRVEKGDVIHLASNLVHGAFLRETDCKVIDIFSPVREDYKQKHWEQKRSQ
jgi:quercetin dioxygenase-like cupin family protein